MIIHKIFFPRAIKVKLLIIVFCCFEFIFAGVTGKISGRITDGSTGEPLIGANVLLENTYLGAATDIDGRFFILNIPPGEYVLVVSMIGYTKTTVTDIRVEIDLTTIIDVAMDFEVLIGEGITVVAEAKIIKMDVAASQLSVTSDEIEELPFTSLGAIVGLKAGITSDMEIRGGDADETMLMVDGMVLRDERDNSPITGIPLSAVKEVSIQTGGFGAEYHNVRSGIVNVVTKEGDPNKYGATITYKYSPPAAKHFGSSVYDPNSYWLLPYTVDSVAWFGTNNAGWDDYTIQKYSEFDGGWVGISERLLTDDDPTNDLTPQAVKQLFMWHHRKDGFIRDPDYNIDLGFGGPIPFVSPMLGNLRFYYSYTKNQDMYLMPLSTDGVNKQNNMLKITSDISNKTKFSLTGFWGDMQATNLSRSGGVSYINTITEVAQQIDRTGFTIPWRIFTNDYYSRTDRSHWSAAAQLSHIINLKSFFEIQVKQLKKTYLTGPGPDRDTTLTEIFPGYFVDEAPFGYETEFLSSVDGGLTMGGPISTSRDSTEVKTTSFKFGYTNQFNAHNQVSTGFELVLHDLHMQFGSINYVLPEGNLWNDYKRNPYRMMVYLQDKIEFKGLITTLGLNIDYSDPNGKWFEFEPYDNDFNSIEEDSIWNSDYLVEADPVITISPRVGISHPITETSRLYFNYGHFNQSPTTEALYRVQRNSVGSISYLGDPSLIPARTISYELGFDQAINDQFLVHVSAYYKDVSRQQDWTRYISQNGKVNFRQLTSNSYSDTRGFEVELNKSRGHWYRGMINYEYRVSSSGYFNLGEYNENPSDQLTYESENRYQDKPIPKPRMKGYLDLFTPYKFGPGILGQYFLGDWHMNFIGRWTSGGWFTYNPNRVSGITNNLQWKDYINLDLKVSKVFSYNSFSVKFFLDIFNVLNIKRFSTESFSDAHDYDYYMQSLHLQQKVGEKLGYGNIPGDDQPGDVRERGVDFVPIVSVTAHENTLSPSEIEIYYDQTTKEYYEYSADGTWSIVPNGRMNDILDTKAYIDMPDQTFFTFLRPRDVFLGINFSYNF